VLWRSRRGDRTPSTPDDLELVPGRASTLARHAADGWIVLGLSWQPEIDAGRRTRLDVDAVIERTRQLLGVAIEIEYCPHAAGPPVCWCRKPLPGLGVALIGRHALDPSRCIYVGAGAQDPGFARRLGFEFRDAGAFFDAGNGG
jgi:histidinol phosphatase-like enzyme